MTIGIGAASQEMGLGRLVAKGVSRALLDIALHRNARTLRVLVKEVGGIVRSLPYAVNCAIQRTVHPPKATISYGQRRGRRPGNGDRRKVDMYYEQEVPITNSQKEFSKRPIVLFVHGGAWGSGERWQYSPLARALAVEAGAIVGIASYRLFPDAMVEEQVTDVRSAISEFSAASMALGFADEERFSVIGHSSGAHLSCLALLKGVPHSDAVGQSATRPSCFIGISGVYDIATHYQYEKHRGVDVLSPMHDAFGGESQFAASSPTQLVTAADESIDLAGLPGLSFLVDSKKDEVVKSSQSRKFGDALRDALRKGGVTNKKVENVSYEGVSHADFVTDWVALSQAPYRKNGPCRTKHCKDLVRCVMDPSAGL